MELPSITDFQDNISYANDVRRKLINYLEKSVGIVATTFPRVNHFTKKKESGLSYHTDGEVIFNNFLFEYIQQDSFFIPQKWFDIIHSNNFVFREFLMDYDLMIDGGVDVFKTTNESFDIEPTIKQAITWL